MYRCLYTSNPAVEKNLITLAPAGSKNLFRRNNLFRCAHKYNATLNQGISACAYQSPINGSGAGGLIGRATPPLLGAGAAAAERTRLSLCARRDSRRNRVQGPRTRAHTGSTAHGCEQRPRARPCQRVCTMRAGRHFRKIVCEDRFLLSEARLSAVAGPRRASGPGGAPPAPVDPLKVFGLHPSPLRGGRGKCVERESWPAWCEPSPPEDAPTRPPADAAHAGSLWGSNLQPPLVLQRPSLRLAKRVCGKRTPADVAQARSPWGGPCIPSTLHCQNDYIVSDPSICLRVGGISLDVPSHDRKVARG